MKFFQILVKSTTCK